jgi:hypothetical protein
VAGGGLLDDECCEGICGVVLPCSDILGAILQYPALPTLLAMVSKNIKPE